MTALEGYRVVVTGASAGIGAAIARAFAEQGASVAGIARNESRLRAAVEPHGGVAIPADLTRPEECTRAVEQAARSLRGIDVLVNNAGTYSLGLLEAGRYEEWRRTFDLNTLAVLAVSQAALAPLRSSGRGHVVNISSVGGRKVGSPATAVYNASKFAVGAISEGIRLELAPEGIRVTVVSPGLVSTEIGGELRDEEAAAHLRRRASESGIPPEDVASAVLYAVGQRAATAVHEIVVGPTSQPL